MILKEWILILNEVLKIDGGGLWWWILDDDMFMQVDVGEDDCDASRNQYWLEEGEKKSFRQCILQEYLKNV